MQLTARELSVVEKEVGKEDEATEAAMKSLSLKLSSNNKSCLTTPSSSNTLLSTTSSISGPENPTSNLLFADFPCKRKYIGVDSSQIGKKFRMGRSSKGNTDNESKNLSKFMSLDDWFVPSGHLKKDMTPSTPYESLKS